MKMMNRQSRVMSRCIAVLIAAPALTTTPASAANRYWDGGASDTGIEWVVGGDPTDGADDSGPAPTLDTTSDPDGKIRFIFRRSSDARADAGITIQVQYGSDLDAWTNAAHQGTGANQITITELLNGFGPGIDRVTVALPASLATDLKLFARLKVEVATP